MEMGRAVHIHSKEQYIQALGVLDKLPGTWQGIGPSSAPVLLLTDAQYNALLEAGVIRSNDKEVPRRGKKATAKKPSPEEALALLQHRYRSRLACCKPVHRSDAAC
jgi:hypothetical protein